MLQAGYEYYQCRCVLVTAEVEFFYFVSCFFPPDLLHYPYALAGWPVKTQLIGDSCLTKEQNYIIISVTDISSTDIFKDRI